MPSTASIARGRQLLAAGDEIAGGVVDQASSGPLGPDRLDHRLDRLGIADVADLGLDLAAGSPPSLAAAAVSTSSRRPQITEPRAQLQEAPAHGEAEAGAAAGDQDALALQKIGLEHARPRAALGAPS